MVLGSRQANTGDFKSVCELQECQSHDYKWAKNNTLNTLTVKGLHSSPTLGTSLGFSGTPAGVFFS